MSTDQKDKISRALGYPYARPEGSYLFTGGTAHPLPKDTSFESRTPVLACGSNGAPEQLRRKYGDGGDVSIPVTAARLDDIACTYSAHFAAYGSISAALSEAPGARSHVHITWLLNHELKRMHETEAIGLNYRFVELDNLSLHCAVTGTCPGLFAYISLRGSLLVDGEPVILAGIHTETPTYKTLSQEDMQRTARDKLAPEMDLHDFILQNISDKKIRQHRTAMLAQKTEHFVHPYMKIHLPEEKYVPSRSYDLK